MLVERAKQGDHNAVEELASRYIWRFQRWARGRLPRWARDVVDTDDLVQETISSSLQRLDSFEPRNSGAFQAYVRRGILNRIRDEARRARAKPSADSLPTSAVAEHPSPLEDLIGRDALRSYESALGDLADTDRQAILLRVELRMKYRDIAREMGKPSPDAARVSVRRAILKLAQQMAKNA